MAKSGQKKEASQGRTSNEDQTGALTDLLNKVEFDRLLGRAYGSKEIQTLLTQLKIKETKLKRSDSSGHIVAKSIGLELSFEIPKSKQDLPMRSVASELFELNAVFFRSAGARGAHQYPASLPQALSFFNESQRDSGASRKSE